MKRFLKHFWPPLLLLIIVLASVGAAWYAVSRDIPVDIGSWSKQAPRNTNQSLKHAVAIRDTTTIETAKAQAQAKVLQQQYGMGILSIPAVNINLTIFSVVTNSTLATGVARYFPDRVMGQGNNVYAAHNLSGADILLSRIGELKTHALIQQTDFKHVFSYRVVYNRVVKKTEVAVLKQTDERRITLIRCEGPYHTAYRRVVIARLAKVTKYTAHLTQAQPLLTRTQQVGAGLLAWQTMKWPLVLLLGLFIVLLAVSFHGYYASLSRD